MAISLNSVLRVMFTAFRYVHVVLGSLGLEGLLSVF